MRLKRIKLAGFKSFVDPTSIPFPDDMTAIVGPNGCGKSNVIDAVRWVLGESSAKNLRGDAMTDVIFNGSSARKPVSQCSVELVFDNSSGRIQGEFANYNELSVKRLVTRDGQSTYFLNSSKCRRRDVTDLFLGTGLGPRSYAIIEQGMISRLIESKPQELRVFIEEAAGISKYKERRRETENRIRHTRENLERLDDVRGELGQQLEKLQRQAAAAKRYKELKQTERRLKSELAAIRWLKHSQHITALEKDISEKEAEIEAYIAQQRGDEKDIAAHREKQADLKQALADVQHTYFQLGTDITRIEQNQIHAKQRRQQIEQELQGLQSSIRENEEHDNEDLARLQTLHEQMDELEPQLMMLEEQEQQVQASLQEAESRRVRFEQEAREQEQSYQQVKQQVQLRHGHIQSNMNMQMRTQQRISELERDLKSLQDEGGSQGIEQAEVEVRSRQEEERACRHLLEQLQNQKEQAKIAEQEAQTALSDIRARLQGVQARLEALEAVQEQETQDQALYEFLDQHGIKFNPFVDTLSVAQDWQFSAEQVSKQLQKAVSVDESLSDGLVQQLPAASVVFNQFMASDRRPGTLAQHVKNDTFPHFLNDIYTATSVTEARALCQSLASHESVITSSGHWFGKDWMLTPADAENSEQGTLARSTQITALQQEVAELREQQALASESVDEVQSAREKVTGSYEAQVELMHEAKAACTQAQNQLEMMRAQAAQQFTRLARVEDDLEEQRGRLQEETEQAETLAMQVEELEMQLGELEEQQTELEQQREAINAQAQSHKHQVEAVKNQIGQITLQIQTAKSQYQSVKETHNRLQQQLKIMRERHESLVQEQAQLLLPLEEQAGQLEEMLSKRIEVEQEKARLSDALADVEQVLADVEKGKSGIEEKVQQMRQALESSKLECEGYRVRAKAVTEQLADMNVALKPVLESLPEQTDEARWQQDLDKTSAAVSRLGAVNLAAVEEYEIQAERKQHLDTQNEDLTSALDTLEQAIRKIDRETRSRFKDTFEQVNNDLKMLFPKVFGGGSAYLDLTDDDLLETGVTIMARPPGKKNSTIHLLSGGEKALTALSLVFAIFRLNPAPFCLLDEVDAPLDDANVGRFCKLVSEMSKSVQFIYITHNKIAMEMATHLTGVTMAEPGVSRMVAVDVDEAVAIAQA